MSKLAKTELYIVDQAANHQSQCIFFKLVLTWLIETDDYHKLSSNLDDRDYSMYYWEWSSWMHAWWNVQQEVSMKLQ